MNTLQIVWLACGGFATFGSLMNLGDRMEFANFPIRTLVYWGRLFLAGPVGLLWLIWYLNHRIANPDVLWGTTPRGVTILMTAVAAGLFLIPFWKYA